MTYATSTLGADHTCDNAVPSPTNPDYNPGASTEQGPVSQFLKIYNAAVDSLSICHFAYLPALDMPELQKQRVSCVSALRGETLDENYLMQLGTSVMRVEREFNDAVGFTNQDDRVTRYFVEEKLPPTGNTFKFPEEELDNVNKF